MHFSLVFLVLPIAVFSALQSWQINEKIQNEELVGDMLLTPQQLAHYGDNPQVRAVNIKGNGINRWQNNIIPYTISPNYSPSQKAIIRTSLQDLERMSCFKFVSRTSESDYLVFVPLDGCYSFVGKTGGRQILSLAIDCLADYIIWHEVMHAIGFEHEHQRPDRDQYIRVEYKNVDPRQLVNFEKINAREVEYPDTYDYQSIMHYDGFAFGRTEGGRRLATMIPLKKGVSLIDNMKMSSVDLRKLNRLGKCKVSPGISKQKVKKQSSSCQDAVPGCDAMKQKGLCTMAFYRDSMAKQCSQTCGFCKRSSSSSSSSSTSTNSCQDTIDCSPYESQCHIEEYSQLMSSLCPATCGLCSKRMEPLCVDNDDNCEVFASNGFCTDSFFDNIRHLRCAKTCKLC